MTPEQFVSALVEIVERGAVRAVQDNLQMPAGRQPPRQLAELSEWYHGLSVGDAELVRALMAHVAHHAVYNLLLALDGLMPMEAGPDKGLVRVIYSRMGAEAELARTGRSDLVGIFKAMNG